jgi:hypothetical protein
MARGPLALTPTRSGVPLEALTPPPWLQSQDLTKGLAPELALRSSPSAQTAGGAQVAKELILQVRQAIRRRNYSRRTEKSYAAWVRRFLAFHRFPDPARLDASHVRGYLTSPSSDASAAPRRTRPSAPCCFYSGWCWIAICRLSRRLRAPRGPCACR